MAAGNCSIFSAVLIMMACQQNGPQRDATNTPCDRFTLTCKEVSMPSHRSRSARREKLSEICRQLGEHASPAEIREEAYRVGFGAVNSSMLIHVRNALWPNRKKHAGGATPGFTPANSVVRACTERDCPSCGATDGMRVRVTGLPKENGLIRRKLVCRKCKYVVFTDSTSTAFVHPRRQLAMLVTSKTCTKCHRDLPIDKFQKKACDSDLYRPSCRECLNKARAVHYRKKLAEPFGCEEHIFAEMTKAQCGKCAICRQESSTLVVDHCHRTNKIRALLCHQCNLAIGNFKDDIQHMEAAIAYLRAHSEGGA